MPPELTGRIDAELGKRWNARRTPVLQGLYEARSEAVHWQDARVSSRLAGIVYIVFFVTDAILIADVALFSIVSRLLIGLAFIFGIDGLIRRGVRSTIVDSLCATGIIVAYTTWLLFSSWSVHTDHVSYYLTYGVIFMIGQNVFFNFRFSLAVTASTILLSTLLGFLFEHFFFSPQYVLATCTLYVSTYVLTLFVNWKLNEERYRVFLNSLQAELRQEEAAERGAALLRLSTTDALTGLANRRAIDDELRAYWDNWQTSGMSFGAILIDVDYFKRYNDQYGHQQGDRCLIAVAQAMKSAVPEHHFALGRFGGEEFILLARCQSRDHIAMLAESVRNAVEALALPHAQRLDQGFVVTVSVGAAFSRDITGTKVERLVTAADRALYDAKESGRNCVRLFDRNAPEKTSLDDGVADLLRTATKTGHVALVYQPIRNAASGEIAAVESLMRVTTPGGKSVSPAVFIPIAERTGAIVELGLWALRTACREMLVPNFVSLVSVNVSAVQLRAPGFALSVAAILGEAGVAPHRLAVEITEGMQIEEQPEILHNIAELRRLGVKMWLDDFGTGFAGLSCIRDVEFDVIKIDRSFLRATDTPRGAEMFRKIIELVRNAGSATVVEGVETPEQQDLAAGQGVELLQGYHLGRPIPADDFRWLMSAETGITSEAPKSLATA